MLLEINPVHPEPRKVRRAADALESGQVIAYPTDTVYGLGCDILNKKAIDRLYQIKGVDRSHNVAFVCRDLSDVAKYAVVDDATFRVLKRFLPGPYCFVLEATRDVPRVLQWPRKQVGVRIPDHPVPLALTRELGRPIVSTTAGRHGMPAELDPKEIDLEFKGLGLVIDAGPGGTVPTSVVDLTGREPQILREGAGDVSPFRV